jgi:hypothetical protein
MHDDPASSAALPPSSKRIGPPGLTPVEPLLEPLPEATHDVATGSA